MAPFVLAFVGHYRPFYVDFSGGKMGRISLLYRLWSLLFSFFHLGGHIHLAHHRVLFVVGQSLVVLDPSPSYCQSMAAGSRMGRFSRL